MNDMAEKLAEVARDTLAGAGARFAYMFGSHATGRAHARSDVDVAVYFDEAASPSDRVSATLDLAGALSRSLGREVDVISLNDVPLSVQGRVLGGYPVYSDDEALRCDFASATMRAFIDYNMHADELARHFIHDIAEGRR